MTIHKNRTSHPKSLTYILVVNKMEESHEMHVYTYGDKETTDYMCVYVGG